MVCRTPRSRPASSSPATPSNLISSTFTQRYGYLLDQQPAEHSERERLALGERLHDPVSQAHLERLGVVRGWRCLDVGAGAGSLVRWLAGRVLPDGEVLATDLDTRLLEPLAACGVRVARADITSGPPAEARFDLVHARLLLIHLPDRASAVIQMAAAARPGGWVMTGDIDFTSLVALDPWPRMARGLGILSAARRRCRLGGRLRPPPRRAARGRRAGGRPRRGGRRVCRRCLPAVPDNGAHSGAPARPPHGHGRIERRSRHGPWRAPLTRADLRHTARVDRMGPTRGMITPATARPKVTDRLK